MKFIKKNIKLIVGIIVSMLLVSGMSVYATYKYFATDVSYIKNGTEINVADALNELYQNKKETTDKNYTEQEYQNYGDTKYNEGVAYGQSYFIGSKVELWKNQNTSSSFKEQTITLNSSLTNYTHFIVQWKRNKNDSDTIMYEDIFKILPLRTDTPSIGDYSYGANGTINNGPHFARSITYENSTQLKFGLPGLISSDMATGDVLIPLTVYGINLSY